MRQSQDSDRILQFYADRAACFGHDARAVGWLSRERQRVRFQTFYESYEFACQSVLDVGCGLGDFYHYLMCRGYQGQYVGIDACESMISLAKTAYPRGSFKVSWLDKYPQELRYDIVVASGILSHQVSFQLSYAKRQIQAAYRLSGQVLMMNMLILAIPKKDRCRTFYYYDLDWVRDCCLQLDPTPQVVDVKKGYLDGDATIIVIR